MGKTTFNFTGFGCELRELELRMTGEYQADNAGVALATIFALEKKGLIKTDEQKYALHYKSILVRQVSNNSKRSFNYCRLCSIHTEYKR